MNSVNSQTEPIQSKSPQRVSALFLKNAVALVNRFCRNYIRITVQILYCFIQKQKSTQRSLLWSSRILYREMPNSFKTHVGSKAGIVEGIGKGFMSHSTVLRTCLSRQWSSWIPGWLWVEMNQFQIIRDLIEFWDRGLAL